MIDLFPNQENMSLHVKLSPTFQQREVNFLKCMSCLEKDSQSVYLKEPRLFGRCYVWMAICVRRRIAIIENNDVFKFWSSLLREICINRAMKCISNLNFYSFDI